MTRDLMFKDEIQQLVADAYADVQDPDGPGARNYTREQFEQLSPAARRWSLGVGNPVPAADLQPGEHVLDLGCGAGIDAQLAAAEVAPSGTVIGIDMLPSMLERGRTFAAEAGCANVCFIHAEMESLPLAEGTVDVVMSNGSINLSARKSRVLAEAFRTLQPGGRLAVTDLTIDEEDLPSEILTHPSAWAG